MEQCAKGRVQMPPLAEDDGMVTVEKILFAVGKIVELAHPVRVVAFGSRARGDHRKGSDLDLAVIVDHFDPKVDPRPVWRADLDVFMDMDLLVYDVARESRQAESPISVQSEVLKRGVILYEQRQGIVDRATASRLV